MNTLHLTTTNLSFSIASSVAWWYHGQAIVSNGQRSLVLLVMYLDNLICHISIQHPDAEPTWLMISLLSVTDKSQIMIHPIYVFYNDLEHWTSIMQTLITFQLVPCGIRLYGYRMVLAWQLVSIRPDFDFCIISGWSSEDICKLNCVKTQMR